ncbi:MAG: TerC/Alx family metal homeostasis membrane protein [Bacteroidia bacterium]
MWESGFVVIAFLLIILISLSFDLGVFTGGYKDKLSLKQSIKRSLSWFLLGLLSVVAMFFLIPHIHEIHDLNGLVEYQKLYGPSFKLNDDYEASLRSFQWSSVGAYFSGFLLEYALSVDNLFVMILVFKSFKVKEHNERKILVYGIIGAMLMRFLFVFLGSAAIQEFHWVLYLFGALLIYSAVKLLFDSEDDEFDPNDHIVMKTVKRLFPVSSISQDRGHFFVRENGKLHVTTLFVVLLVIELTDVVFAIDSVPAVFGVTRDPYLVFFSNIFAILGLRSLYFLVGHGIDKFWALQYGLAIILVFIGGKMIFEDYFHAWGFNHFHNLLVIVSLLAGSLLFSVWKPQNK